MASSQDFGNQVVNNAMANDQVMGQPVEMPFWAATMENIPAATAVMGDQMRRGSNTIMRGGYKQKGVRGHSTRLNNRGMIRNGIANNNPLDVRNWTRFRDQNRFFPDRGSPKYSPYFLSDMGNKFANAAGNADSFVSKNLLSDKGRARFSRMAEHNPDQRMMSGGIFAQINTSARIGSMSDARFSKLAGKDKGLTSYFTKAGFGAKEIDSLLGPNMGRTAARQALLANPSGGVINQKMGGFMAAFLGDFNESSIGYTRNSGAGAARALRWGKELGVVGETATNLRGVTARSTLKAGFGKATAQGIGKKAGMKIGAKTAMMAGATLSSGPAAPVVGAVMTLWMAYDLAKMAGNTVGYAAKYTAQAMNDFRGDLNRGPMDARFQDTEAAATSRARGVQAIQSSRLNMRSVLGSEASMMAGAFG